MEGIPLDKRKIQILKSGVLTKVPALSLGFVEDRPYVHFVTPSFPLSDAGQPSAEEEEWLEAVAFFSEDLKWLLELPYHRFWSQVAHDKNLHKCLESFLSQSFRAYDLPNLELSERVSECLKRIRKQVFLVYLRMSTYKESKESHMSPETFADIIYENYVFDFPKILDLCALYGLQNLAIMSKMVKNIFTTQVKYNEDLSRASQVMLEAFSNIEDALSMNLKAMPTTCTTFQTNGLNKKKQFKISSFYGFLNYVTDIAFTLHSFFEVYPYGCEVFYQSGAPTRIVTFYENVFPVIERDILQRIKQIEDKSLKEDFRRKFSISKTLLVKNFRSIINYCFIQNILNFSLSEVNQKENESSHIEQFFDIFTEIVTEKYFLQDYNSLYPLETDLELFNEIGVVLDPQRLSYIFSGIHDSAKSMPDNLQSSAVNGARPKVKKHNVPNANSNTLRNAVDILRGEDFYAKNTENSGPSEIEVSSLIQNVKELFPDLGDGFIEKCLEHLHYDHERVIDALITVSLPDHLIAMDRNLKRSVELEEEDDNSKCSILSERKNVYDNDEFDIFSRKDVDLDKIHIGKKEKTPVTYENLAKDPESALIKQIILNRGDEECEFRDQIDIYDDEYDDTYDSVMFGLNEHAPEGGVEDEVPGAVEQPSEEPSGPVRDASNDFCTNPEILREKRQQRWESKQAARGNFRDRGEPSSEQSRLNKDRNKAHVANHNRRKQADFKRSRGMIPS